MRSRRSLRFDYSHTPAGVSIKSRTALAVLLSFVPSVLLCLFPMRGVPRTSALFPFNLRPSREITWVDFGGWFQVFGCVDEKRLWATGGIKWIKLELHKSPSRTTANASVLEWRHPSSVNSNPVNSLHYSFYLLECRKKTPWWNHSNRFFFFFISHTQFVVLKCRQSCVILSS